MVTCNDPDLWSRMWSFKDHGKNWDAVHRVDHPPGFRWLHESFGTNWRMIEMQAVIGRIQLQRMAQWTSAREANAAAITAALSPFCGPGGPLRLPSFGCWGCNGCDNQTGCRHARYKYYAYVRPEHMAPGWDRDRIVAEINRRGVPAYQGSCSEVYLEAAFKKANLQPAIALPTAHELGQTSLMLLVHPTLTRSEIDKTAAVLADVLAGASL